MSKRILVTNDDGIGAAGIQLLEQVARQFSDDVWVVAPETNHSGAGHSLTLRRPLRVRSLSPRHFAVDGTPTDCILLGLQNIIKDGGPVDLVLSGVNHGGNLGEDMTYSGTVSAAMEATLFKVPAIAFSQVNAWRHPCKWPTAEEFAPKVIAKLIDEGWPQDVLINVNFPDRVASEVAGIKVTSQGRRKLGDDLDERIDPRGEPYVWIGALREETSHRDGTDLSAIQAGFVSVTPIHLDMTHYETMARLREQLE